MAKARKVRYINANPDEEIVKYNDDYAAYEIEEDNILAAITDPEMDNDLLIKAVKKAQLSSAESARIILAVIGNVIESTEYVHEAALLKAAKAYCVSIKDYEDRRW